MAGAAKCLLHALLGAGEHVAAGAHGAANQHRLPCELVVSSQSAAPQSKGCEGRAVLRHDTNGGTRVNLPGSPLE